MEHLSPSPTFLTGQDNFGYENEVNPEGRRSATSNGMPSRPNGTVESRTGTPSNSTGAATAVISDSEDSVDFVSNGSSGKDGKYLRTAIRVERAKKKFGNLTVLNGLYMTVQEGTIYGLLGSSGCGKTTILSAIVGLRRLDEGRISIFGKTPGTRECGVPGRLVGYMPQEIALNGEFTMLEVCQYFGRLYGMDMERVNERVEYLVNLLDLKKCRGQLGNFSGGQKRRVSFLVALLHEPEILILDEPTVGVDPILRAKIWNHIRELTDTYGTTVILTTHYIEEMRQAERVGIMRGGHLMAEASPETLMAFHKAKMLEEVVLKYCLTDKAEDNRMLRSAPPRKNTISFESEYGARNSEDAGKGQLQQPSQDDRRGLTLPPPYVPVKHNDTDQLNRLWALTTKNVIVLLRNVGFVLFLLVVPSVIVSFFAIAIGKEPKNLGMGFVSEELSSLDFCDKAPPISCAPEHLSCGYFDTLASFNVFDLHKYNTVGEAIADVDKQVVWGYVHFSQNYSQYTFNRTLRHDLSNATIEGSKIRVRLDMSTILTGALMKKLIYDAYRAFSVKFLTLCQVELTGRDLPVEFEEPIYGEENGTFTGFIIPGLVVGFLPFFSCVSCILSYIIEKKDGMIDRSKVAGVTAFDVILSHAIPQFGIAISQILLTFIIMYFVDIPLNIGNPFLAFSLTLFCTVVGMCMGFAAAEIFDEEKNAMLFAMAALFPSFVLAGIFWPLESIPQSIRYVSYFLPATMPGKSIRSILYRGWGLSNSAVYMGFVSQVAFILFYIALTFVVHKIKK